MAKLAAFLDAESTGLGHHDKVIELAVMFFAVEGDNYEHQGDYHIYNMVDRVISIDSQRIHGITPSKLQTLSKGISYTHYLSEVYGLLSMVDFVFAHNVSFDRRIITGTYGNVFSPEAQFFDTRDSAKFYLGKGYKLKDFVAQSLLFKGLPTDLFDKEFKTLYGEGGYHGALYDTYVMARAYMLLNNKTWTYPNT